MKYGSSFQNNRRREKKKGFRPKTPTFLFLFLFWLLKIDTSLSSNSCGLWCVYDRLMMGAPLQNVTSNADARPAFFCYQNLWPVTAIQQAEERERDYKRSTIYDVCTTHTLFFFLLPCVGGACFVLHDRDRSSGLELACD